MACFESVQVHQNILQIVCTEHKHALASSRFDINVQRVCAL